MSEEKAINFEEELNRLKQIVNDIQQKDLSIDESLKLYEEGQKIISLLSEELKKAEDKSCYLIQVYSYSQLMQFLGTYERNTFQRNLKFFSLPFMFHRISNGEFCPNMRLALTTNRDFASEPPLYRAKIILHALISNICVKLPELRGRSQGQK